MYGPGSNQMGPQQITLADVLNPSFAAVAIPVGGPDSLWEVHLRRHADPTLVSVNLVRIRPGLPMRLLAYWSLPRGERLDGLLAEAHRLVTVTSRV